MSVTAVVAAMLCLCASPAYPGRELRVGAFNYPPLISLDADGAPAGVFVEILKDVAAENDWHIQYVGGTWQEGLDRLAAGDIDLAVCIAQCRKRSEACTLSREPVVSTWAQLYTPKGMSTKTVAELDGQAVAGLRDDAYFEAFKDLANAFSVRPVYVVKDSLLEVFGALSNGTARAAVCEHLAGHSYEAAYGVICSPLVFYPQSVGFAVPAGSNQDVLAVLDQYIKAGRADPSSRYHEIMQALLGEAPRQVIPLYLLWCLGGAGVLFVVFAGASIFLRRQVRLQTRALLEQKEALEHEVVRRKEIAEALRSAKEDWERTFDAVPDLITILDEGYRIVRVNKAMAARLGVRPEECVGRTCYQVVHAADAPPPFCPHRLLLQDGAEHTAEVHEKNLNGDFLVSVSPLRDAAGALLGSVHIARDVTEQKHHEAALAASRAQLEVAMNMVDLVHWEYDVETNMFDFDEQFYALYGTSAEREGGTKMSAESYAARFLPPEDAPLVAAEVAAAQSATDPNYAKRLEHRIIRADGEERYIAVCFRIVKDGTGRTIRTYGANQDITEHKQIEERLRRDVERERCLLELYDKAVVLSDKELYQCALAYAVQLTGSTIGFFHLVSDDQQSIILTAWNDAALEQCTAQYDAHYPLERAGNWVDCVRLKRPVIYNDYLASPNKKGMPEGHAPVSRFMSVPVLDGAKVSIIFGVGNKPKNYDDRDMAQLQMVASELHKIMKQRRADAALRDASRFSQQVIASAQEGIVVYGTDLRYQLWNHYMEQMTGLRAEDVLGRHPLDLFPFLRDAGVISQIEAVLAGGATVQIETTYIVPQTGRTGWASDISAPLRNASGEIIGVIGTVRDISRYKEAEEALRMYHEQLEDIVKKRTEELVVARDQALAADRLKSSFLATMSHELRTPLSSIIGFSEILLLGLSGPLNDEQKKQLGMVRDSSTHLQNLINNVLDLSKIEAGQLQVQCERFGLRTSIESVMKNVRALAEKKSIALEADVAQDVDVIVSDRRRFEQILLNLLDNAVKFTERGRVRLECSALDGYVLIRVIDTGIGIKDVDVEKLFRPFQQVDTRTTRRYEGTGLGLSICKRLLELLGGDIWVESEWEKGSTFTFTLPVERKES